MVHHSLISSALSVNSNNFLLQFNSSKPFFFSTSVNIRIPSAVKNCEYTKTDPGVVIIFLNISTYLGDNQDKLYGSLVTNAWKSK